MPLCLPQSMRSLFLYITLMVAPFHSPLLQHLSTPLYMATTMVWSVCEMARSTQDEFEQYWQGNIVRSQRLHACHTYAPHPLSPSPSVNPEGIMLADARLWLARV